MERHSTCSCLNTPLLSQSIKLELCVLELLKKKEILGQLFRSHVYFQKLTDLCIVYVFFLYCLKVLMNIIVKQFIIFKFVEQ